MKIRITQPEYGQWFNAHIGETFDVLRHMPDEIPPRYEVDVTRLRKAGILTADIAYVNWYCAEETQEEPDDRD